MDERDEQRPNDEERDEQQPKAENVDDLDVPEEESDQVKGGLNFSKIEYKN